MVPCSTF